jgi:hypothetical protein
VTPTKVLFLDIDGVLNSRETMISRECLSTCDGRVGMALSLLLNLKRIVDLSNCDVVISSTWRVGGVEEGTRFHQELTRYPEGESIFRRVIGRTVDGWHFFEDEDVSKFSKARSMRGAEIREWLGRHPTVERFAIVDDDSDMGDLMPHLFKTSNELGLTEEIADRIAAYLNGEASPC